MHDTTVFKKSTPFTLGVEVEFQLLDSESLDLTHAAPAILAHPACDPARIKKEFIKSMVEVTTGVCKNPPDVADDLKQTIKMLEDVAWNSNCLIHAASLHPFARASDQQLSDDPRYRHLLDELQIVGRRLITQGLHVHVGMPDGETAIRVFDGIRPLLPLLLALSASSPFFEAEDTGLCSYRSKLFEALPRSGMPGAMNSWRDYSGFIKLLTEAGVIGSPRDIWWDVRPHPELGTIEIRICDVPSRFRYIVAIAAIIQASALMIASGRKDTLQHANRAIINNNKWQAVRYGLEAEFVHALDAGRSSAPDAIRTLLDRLRPFMDEFRASPQADVIEEMLQRGCSANRQRRIYMESGQFEQIIREERAGFWK